MHRIEIVHEGLRKHRIITGKDLYVVRQKAAAQQVMWEDAWEKAQQKQREQQRRAEARAKEQDLRRAEAQRKSDLRDSAIEQSLAAEKAIDRLRQTLKHTLKVNDRIDWESLKDRRPFRAPPKEPQVPSPGREPHADDVEFEPDVRWFDNLFWWRLRRAEREAVSRFADAHQTWKRAVQSRETAFADYEAKRRAWQSELEAFNAERIREHSAIDAQRERYLRGDAEAVQEYCDLVLSKSEYSADFPQEWDLEFLAETKTAIVDYSLPSPESLPRLKEVKYVQAKDDLVELELSEKERESLYDEVIYQVAIRTIHELFEADAIGALDSVVFNGWVNSLDRAIGRETNKCILSLHVQKAEFEQIDLSRVDPKACFRKLKGVGSSKLHSLTAVAPIMKMNREDKRFVQAESVAGMLNEGFNLAAMEWEDFEHLIREVFEQEFASSGGEVKITRASRDAGVDAVAFDPDPIRGGKIVIQAKRYTNTVGVSAVRDLYGTMMNEGAIKGILVSTADYGPDAYDFIKGKPLALLNGSNLLHLLAKHGRKARIDLAEAKKVLRAMEES